MVLDAPCKFSCRKEETFVVLEDTEEVLDLVASWRPRKRTRSSVKSPGGVESRPLRGGVVSCEHVVDRSGGMVGEIVA